MFFVLSKVLVFFVKPTTWVLGCLIGSHFIKKVQWKKRLFWAGIIMLIFFTNQYISNRVMQWWEPEPIPMADVGTYDVAVVFSGVTRGSLSPRDRVYFGQGADRITHTLQLYNEGKIKHILVTGGLGFQQVNNSVAADRLHAFLTMAGVPDSVITVERNAVNTYENALNSAKILKEQFPGGKYLLITSAFHMKRSAMCLENQGVIFDKFPAGYQSSASTMNFDDLVVPNSSALNRWELITKELVGILIYKVMGYL